MPQNLICRSGGVQINPSRVLPGYFTDNRVGGILFFAPGMV